ncbi:MAG: hypothetical protein H7Y38_06325 [Armatimonadetes bacterium]|nr:hypothetical protein [Armatimonadota bacterium]
MNPTNQPILNLPEPTTGIPAPKKVARRWMIVPALILGLASVLPIGNQASLLSAVMGQGSQAQLTIIARADGTYDVKEYAKPDLWFAPEAVGEALEVTAKRRFGNNAKVANINILVKADPGVQPGTIQSGILSARARGFMRFGFSDPRIGSIAQQVTSVPVGTVQAAQ